MLTLIDSSAAAEPIVKIEERQFNTNQGMTGTSLLGSLASLPPDRVPPQNVENAAHHAPFEFDENTLRSLQHFIESQGLHSSSQSSQLV